MAAHSLEGGPPFFVGPGSADLSLAADCRYHECGVCLIRIQAPPSSTLKVMFKRITGLLALAAVLSVAAAAPAGGHTTSGQHDHFVSAMEFDGRTGPILERY